MARTLRLFAPPKRVIAPLIIFLVVVVVVLPLLLSTGWVIAQYAIERTTRVEFCISCHSMAPMGEAYRMDVHAGRSTHGVRASCSSCHLPDDDPVRFAWVYWQRLVGDAWVEFVHAPEVTDWNALREKRESYVYDSGCLGCHANLLDTVPRHAEALVSHEQYFSGETQARCVTCHTAVGHKELGDYLSKDD
jgi:cytochrome c-type protein NapC